MFLNIFSTFSAKKSNTGKTGPQPSKPTVPATRQKKPSAFGRVLKALRPSGFKTQGRQNQYSQATTVNHEIYLEPDYFDSYDPYATLTSPDVATPALPSPTLTDADSSPHPPPHSAISTPTTVYSEYPPSAPTPEQSPRPSEDLSKARKKPAVRKPIIITSPPESHNTHRSKGINATVNNSIVPPVDGLVGKRDSKAEARQIAIDRLVEALAGHQKAQARPLSELDRLWDAREAKALAKEEEEARLRTQPATCVTTRWEPTRAGLAV
ncbi:hypothetical protein FRC04_011279 [Tulasnella sp. 424]|nr:hypothetical protein FRC04_011279 [Tulasnella sp. 424]KAG8971818.1 hypothetical protein FRC05_010778 [Tulasnella sp. 425]